MVVCDGWEATYISTFYLANTGFAIRKIKSGLKYPTIVCMFAQKLYFFMIDPWVRKNFKPVSQWHIDKMAPWNTSPNMFGLGFLKKASMATCHLGSSNLKPF